MGNKRKIKRTLLAGGIKKYPVLIVKPHNVEYIVDERVGQFIMKAFQRGVGEYLSYPSKVPELARNRAIQQFLHSTEPAFAKKTHIFFLDADTCPVNDFAIERLLGLKKDVVGGVAPIVRTNNNTISCMWSAIMKGEDGKRENIGIGELPKKLFKADRVGGTTLLMSRRALEKLKPPYQMTTYNDSWTDVKLSEDYYFSDKIREAGFDIWVDPETVCNHYHNFNLLDIFAIWEQSQKKTA